MSNTEWSDNLNKHENREDKFTIFRMQVSSKVTEESLRKYIAVFSLLV